MTVGRGLSFGAAAEAYERFRLGYPNMLVDAVLDYAGRPVRTALEIGAGTGKATRAFIARGIEVTATEPDPAMLDELRRQVPAARTVRASLETLAIKEQHSYDVVFVAAALHWTQRDRRWTRIAALLRDGGVFASFGGPLTVIDPATERAIHEARSPELEDDHYPSPDDTPADSAMQWPGTELLAAPEFTAVRQFAIPRRATMSADDFVGYLGTVSAYLQLPQQVRADVLHRIRTVLPAEVEVNGDLMLHCARRRA